MAVRVLAIADVEDRSLVGRLEGRGSPLGRIDLVVSCGDLSPAYLDYVATMANAQLCYVRGNHDTSYVACPPGGIDLHGRVQRIIGLNVAGLEGSIRYRGGIVSFTQRQMWAQALRVQASARIHGGIDLLVTHTPPCGHGDLNDLPHQGFEAFNWLLEHAHPSHMLHGHTHLDYARLPRERVHPSGTALINCFGYQILEIEPGRATRQADV